MKLPRRQFLHLAAGAAAVPAASRMARAEVYPSRPIRWIVAFPAGGTADAAARIMGQWLSERPGQPVVIENRPGAAMNIALQAAITTPPDGYTVVEIGSNPSSNAAVCAALHQPTPVDYVRDCAPVAAIADYLHVLAMRPSFPT
jgi:tripartite-type tricarboxylate transporter receptor subunit TctC